MTVSLSAQNSEFDMILQRVAGLQESEGVIHVTPFGPGKELGFISASRQGEVLLRAPGYRQ